MTQTRDAQPGSPRDLANQLFARAVDRARRLRRWPVSTYRLQFHAGFTFRDAAAVVPYLASLGVTHVYASPYFQARPGSTHGYDVINHARLNPEVGAEADYQFFLDALRANGMSHILDIVPNHAGVGANDNAWWNDVLENGRASRFAEFFDIAWDNPPRCEQQGKVVLPLLGAPLGSVLEKGDLKVAIDAGGLVVRYYDRQFPLSPQSYGIVLDRPSAFARSSAPALSDLLALVQTEGPPPSADAVKQKLMALYETETDAQDAINRAIAEINGRPGQADSFDRLEDLLNRQHYRLAYWRVAGDEINYRRFFDINDLAALRMEKPEVFDAAHELVMRLLADGRLAGVRVDHPDGLYDPAEYFRRLQSQFLVACARVEYDSDAATSRTTWEEMLPLLAEQADAFDEQLLYVAVEKILAIDEPLDPSWPVSGTSGYDALIMLNSLFVPASNGQKFSAIYREFVPDAAEFDELVYQKKLLVLDTALAGDVEMLVRRLDDIAQAMRHGRDFTQNLFRQVLRQVIACFGVYRTYITAAGASAEDRRQIDAAIGRAQQRNPAIDESVFKFIRDVLLLKHSWPDALREKAVTFAGKFQQLTAPATAKGIEDTAFYIYNRLVSLNEVGGEPGQFGIEPERLHRYLADRQEHWPAALTCLSTHDTKRSEDVRARLNVLAEIPEQWGQAAGQWRRINERHRQLIGGEPAPHPNDEYLLYQTLVGAWPLNIADEAARQSWIDRVIAYMQKAMREAKARTSWTRVNSAYEDAVAAFVGGILNPVGGKEFLAAFLPFQQRISQLGMVNSLSQTVLRLAAPGVPDAYQGTELWDYSLVDPDNRRPVDYGLRQNMLTEMEAQWRGADAADLANRLAQTPQSGLVKMLVNWRLLNLRIEAAELFSAGDYVPLVAAGPRAENIFAFARQYADRTAIICVPRLVSQMLEPGEQVLVRPALWDGTNLSISPPCRSTLRNIFTGERLSPAAGDAEFPVATLLAQFPVGVWISES